MECKRLKYKGFRMNRLALFAIILTLLFTSQIFALDVPGDVQTAYDNKMYDEAIQKIQKALERDKRNEDLYYLLGKSYEKKRQFEDAIEALDRAVQISSKFHEARYDLGKLYLRTDQLEKAKKEFEEGLKKTKEGPEKALFEDGMGLYYLETEDYTDADIQFRKAQINDPDNIDYVMHQGDASYEQGIYAVALSAYKRALSEDSTNAELHYRLSKCYLQQKQFQKSMEHIQKTIELDSTYYDAYIDAGNIFTLYGNSQADEQQRIGLLSNAIQYYDLYLSHTGDSGIANYWRGRAYYIFNDFEKAVNDFEAALRIGVDKDDLMSWIGRSYAKLREYDKAIEFLDDYMKRVLAADPNYNWTAADEPIFVELAKAYAGKGDDTSRLQAKEYFEEALALDSSDAMAYYFAGLNCYYLKEYQCAVDKLMKHIDLLEASGTKNAGAYINVGYAYLGMKDWDNTILYINKASEANPEYECDANELLAKVFYQKENHDSAIHYYKKVKECAPDKCESDRWIGIMYLVKKNSNPTKAIEHLKMFQNCLRSQGKNPCSDIEVYELIMKAYQLKEDANSAFEWAGKCLKCDPNNEECKKTYDELEFEIDL